MVPVPVIYYNAQRKPSGPWASISIIITRGGLLYRSVWHGSCIVSGINTWWHYLQSGTRAFCPLGDVWTTAVFLDDVFALGWSFYESDPYLNIRFVFAIAQPDYFTFKFDLDDKVRKLTIGLYSLWLTPLQAKIVSYNVCWVFAVCKRGSGEFKLMRQLLNWSVWGIK